MFQKPNHFYKTILVKYWLPATFNITPLKKEAYILYFADL